MATKGKQRRAPRRTQTKVERPPSATAAGRFTLLLEKMEEQNRATIEAVFASARQLERKMDERFERLEARVTALEVAVRMHSEAISRLEERVSRLEDSVSRLEREVSQLRTDMTEAQRAVERKTEQSAFEALSARVTALELRVAAAQ